MTVKRMNWGCGPHPVPGWINSDQKIGPGIDISCILAKIGFMDNDFTKERFEPLWNFDAKERMDLAFPSRLSQLAKGI